MRLLKWDDNGEFTLTTDLAGDNIPPYAILSHTWGPNTEEVTFRDLVDGTGKDKEGYEKIRFCAKQARLDRLQFFWVDTCCIDKSNNSELSEAINSMFQWYHDAAHCYVYLLNISTTSHNQNIEQSKVLWESDFRTSRWFNRGWTLQELLAPKSVAFFTREGQRIGDKRSLEQQIHEITGIAIPALQGAPLSQFKVNERLKWAETRQTTRDEDMAYCLLGIFDVFMPLIYGEGKENAIRRLRKEIADRQGETPQPFATIPFRRDPDFVNRGDVLDQINQQCSEPAARVALIGLGGVGKSQLAIEFAHRVATEQTDTWIFWIHAGTKARVEAGFRAIADVAQLSGRKQPMIDIPQLVYSWLSNEENGRWVMVIDSADDRDVFYTSNGGTRDNKPLAEYLPQSRNGTILITTRDKDLARRLTGHHNSIIEVGTMVPSDALLLLKKKLGLISDADSAAELVRALDYFPLAISQAASYIQKTTPRNSLEKYLAKFREDERKKTRLLGHDSGDLRRDGSASNAILTTWQISFQHIRTKRRSAADLLSLMSFFDRQGIPESLLKSSRNDENAGRQSRLEGQEDWGSGGLGDSESSSSDGETDDAFEEDIAILRDYCLVIPNEDGDVFEMHGLVQLSTRKWLEACNLQEKFKQQFVSQMAASFPTGDYANWTRCQSLFAHVEAAMDFRPAEGRLEEAWATLLYNGGCYARSQGKYNIAERMLYKARSTYINRLGKEDGATLESTSLFALVLLDRGRWGEAEKLFVQVMETRKMKLGAHHPDTLTSMANLASTYRSQGRWEKAEKLEVQVMETIKTKLGADHPDTLNSMANLASTYRSQGRWEEAEKLEVQVMETSKTKLGAGHPDTLTSMANLASTFWNQGRWEEAEKLEVQVMETSKTKLGADHPDTLNSMANLASTYRSQGRWEEAEKLQVQVMEMTKTKLGADHPDTLTSMANLASTYRSQGRWKEAEKLEVQVMETSKTKLGADHPDTSNSMANLASTYRKQGRWEEAEKLQVQVMEMTRTKLGADHPNTLTSMNNLAFTWKSQGQHSDALALMKSCALARQRVIGPEHPHTRSSLAALDKWSS